jgi:4'-phosphopantetheinyl transferase
MGLVSVVVVRLACVEGGFDDLALLSDDERARAARLADPAPFVTGRAVLRRLAGSHLGLEPTEVTLTRRCATCGSTAHGRPAVWGRPDVAVSLSRSGRRVLAGLSFAGPLGVDIQGVHDCGFDGFDAVALAPGEEAGFGGLAGAALLRARARHWARKEALLKATGHGLVVDPTTVRLGPPAEPPVLVAWHAPAPGPGVVALADLAGPGGAYAAAVAVLAPAPVVVRQG